MLEKFTLRQPFDAALQLQSGLALSRAVLASLWASGAVVMHTSVTTVEAAVAYLRHIQEAVPEGRAFAANIAVCLTGKTTGAELRRGFVGDNPTFKAARYSPYDTATDIRDMGDTLTAMEGLQMPLYINAEQLFNNGILSCFDTKIPPSMREHVFMEETFPWIVDKFPLLPVVVESVSTEAGVKVVEALHASGGKILATITPNHLVWTINDLFDGGFWPGRFCFPILGNEADREALRNAATSSKTCWALGTSSVPIEHKKKYGVRVVPGIFNAPTALGTYAQVFEETGTFNSQAGEHIFESFCSIRARNFLGIPMPEKKTTMVREPWTPIDNAPTAIFLAGHEILWQNK